MNTPFTCKNESCRKSFVVIYQEGLFYRDKKLPMPDLCPACRHRQRMALRSERQLYKRTCGKCAQSMFSIYPPEAPYIIYCQTCFWGNIGWDWVIDRRLYDAPDQWWWRYFLNLALKLFDNLRFSIDVLRVKALLIFLVVSKNFHLLWIFSSFLQYIFAPPETFFWIFVRQILQK